MRFLRLLLILVAASSASAATFTWNGAGGDGSYTNPANWVGGVVPPSDGTATVVFGNTGAGVVTLPGHLRVADIRLENTVGHSYVFEAAPLSVLSLYDGLAARGGGTVSLSSNIALDLRGDQIIDVAAGDLSVTGLVLGHATVTKKGAGRLHFDGLTVYSGGTRVEQGSLIYHSPLAVPAAGGIQAAYGSYVGASFTDHLQSAFLNRLDNENFRGTIGLEAAPGATSPAVFSDRLDVSHLRNFAGFGSKSDARVTGEIRVGNGNDYRFGNGGGTLSIESNLSQQGRNVMVFSTYGDPLTLLLRGNNTFTGSLYVAQSVVVLDSGTAVGASTPLYLKGDGYLGYTERFGGTPNGFLARLGDVTSPTAIVGIDSAQPQTHRTVNHDIDLSGGGTRHNPYYLGTTSHLTLTGTITPTTGDSLYLTALKGGHLNVASTLGASIPSVVIGQSNPFYPVAGTVELSQANTYSVGTQVRGGTLRLSHDQAAGGGRIDLGAGATLDVASGTTISNALALSSDSRLTGRGGLSTPGGVNIVRGATLAPGGFDQVGTLTFSSGLTFHTGSIIDFDLQNVSGTPGAGWDFINVTGANLNFHAAPQSISININTLMPGGGPGPLGTFDPGQNYSWLLASAGAVNGFSTDLFTFNTASFASSLNGGTFFLTQADGGVALNFAPVPEPSTWMLMGIGLLAVGFVEYRGRQRR